MSAIGGPPGPDDPYGAPWGREARGAHGRPRGVPLVQLRDKRLEAGHTTRSLAEASGVHRNTINRLENGRQGASWETVYALAGALKTGWRSLTDAGEAGSGRGGET